MSGWDGFWIGMGIVVGLEMVANALKKVKQWDLEAKHNLEIKWGRLKKKKK